MKKKTTVAKQESQIKAQSGIKLSQLNKYLGLLLAAIAFILYANTLNHDYTVDDGTVMQNNKIVKKGVSAIPEIFTTAYRKGFWDRNESLYRPLSVAMFAVEWQLAPENPAIGHWVNVLLYVLTAWLLFRFLVNLFKDDWLFAFVTTLIYVIHPIHTEVVANIKSRDEILCFLFLILSFNSFLNLLDKAKPVYALGVLFYFVLSLLSKESSVTAIIIFPLIAYFFRQHTVGSSIKLSWSPAIAIVVYLSLRFVVLKGISNFNEILPINNSIVDAQNYFQQLATAVMIAGKYLYLLIIPYPLSFDYSYNTFPVVDFSNIKAFFSLAVYVFLLIMAIKGFKSRSRFSFGIFYFLLTMSIVSNVFFLIESVMAERFTYLPSLGICIALTSVLFTLFKVSSVVRDKIDINKIISANRMFFGLILIVFVVYGGMTVARNAKWKSNLTLLATDVKTCPESARIRYAYGSAILIEQALKEKDHSKKMNLLDKSIEQLEKGVAILPTYSEAYYHLGLAYKERENYDKAIESFEKASKSKTFTDPQFFISWGVACGKAKRYQESIKALNHAIDLDPAAKEAYLNLGVLYDEMQESDKAETSLMKAIKLDSLSDGAYYNLGNVFAHRNNFVKAIQNYKKALEINPTNEDAVNNTGNSYAAMQDYENAIIYFRKAIELNPANTRALNNLGVTLMLTGKKEEGEQYIAKARAIGN